MKTDRFSLAFTRAAAAFLAALLIAGLPAASEIHLGRLTIGFESDSKKLAQALVPQVAEVRKKLDENRRALRTTQGSDGNPAFLRKDVADLVDRTGKDLDQAIVNVQPSDLAPLRSWSTDKLAQIQAQLAALPRPKTAAFSYGLPAPRAVVVLASFTSSPKKPAKPKAVAPKPNAPPPPDTVPAEKSNSVLDEVEKVVSQIFVLASNDDLEVRLWVGSTAKHTAFSFWPKGQIKDDTPATHTVRTDGKLDHLIRGLYSYKAAWTQGAVTQSIQYPSLAGTPAAQTPSERLDLVNGSGFFCCRFNEHYCGHVASEKECRP